MTLKMKIPESLSKRRYNQITKKLIQEIQDGNYSAGDRLPPERELAEKRVYPAIDLQRSGTRKEELLIDSTDLNRIWLLRKVLNPMSPNESMEFLLDRIKKSQSNKEFLDSMNS